MAGGAPMVAWGLSLLLLWALAGSPRPIAGGPPWHRFLGHAEEQRMGPPPALVRPSLRLRGGAYVNEIPSKPSKPSTAGKPSRPLTPGLKAKIDRKKKSKVRLQKGKASSKAEARRKRKVDKRANKGKARPASARAGRDGGGREGREGQRPTVERVEVDSSGEESGKMRDEGMDDLSSLRVAMGDSDGTARINATELKALAAKLLPPKNILRPFWDPQGKGRDLASMSAAKRQMSEDKLMHALKAAQYGSSKVQDGGAGKAAAQRHAHLSYALERLVKGMSSTRDCAGEGFCNGLRRLLEEFPPSLIPPQEVLALMDKHLNFTSTKIMRSDLIELARGHLNGVLALAQGLQEEARTDAIMANLCQRLLSIIARMGASKELSLAAAELFADLAATIEDRKCVEKMVLPYLGAAVGTTDRELDPTELLMILRLQRNATERTTAALGGWMKRAGRLLSDPSHVGKLVKTLVNATRPENEGAIHPVWEDAVWEACRGEGGSTTQAIVQSLWIRCAEPMRASLRLQVVAYFVEHAPWASLVRIISPLTASALISASYQGGGVATTAKEICALLERRFGEEGRKFERDGEQVLRALVEAHTHFDARMGTRLISTALARLGDDARWNHVSLLADKLLAPPVDRSVELDRKGRVPREAEVARERVRRECVDAMSAVAVCMEARQQPSKGDPPPDAKSDWKARAELKAAVCKLLARHAFFEGKAVSKIQSSSKRESRLLQGNPNPALAPETCRHMQKKLLGLLSSMQSTKKADMGEAHEEELMIMRQVDEACDAFEKAEGLKLVIELDEEDRALRQQVRGLCKRLKSEGAKQGSSMNEIVFRHLGLFKLTNPQDPQIHDIIKGLANRCEEALQKGNKAEGMGEQHVVDMVLFLLAQDSHALRDVAIRAFRAVVGEMGTASLSKILEVARTGRVEGAEAMDDEENVFDKLTSQESADSSEESMSDEDLQDDDGDEQVSNEVARKREDGRNRTEGQKGQKEESGTAVYHGGIFGPIRGLPPGGIPLSQADSEDLRELEERFVAARKIKRSALHDETQMMHLRVRCIELVELWAKAHPRSALLITDVIPFLLDQLDECYSSARAVRASMHDRVLSVMTKTVCKGADHIEGDVDEVSINATALIQNVLERPVHSVETQNAAVGLVCWAIRNVEGEDKADCFDCILDCVNKSMTTRKSSIGLRLMKGLAAKRPSWGLMLLAPVIGYVASARSPYLRLEALSGLQAIVTHGEGLRSEGYVDSVRKCLSLVGESLVESVRDLGANLRKGKPRKEWGRCVMSIAKVLDKGSTSKWSRLASDLRAAVEKARQNGQDRSGEKIQGKTSPQSGGVSGGEEVSEPESPRAPLGKSFKVSPAPGDKVSLGEEVSDVQPESPRAPMGKSFKVSLKLSAEGKREGCVQVS